MTTPTDNNRELLTVVAVLRAKPGKEQEVRAGLEELVAKTQGEAGNVNYDLHQGADDPALFCFYENWESPEHLQAHMGQPHLQAFIAKAEDLLDGPLAVHTLRRVA